MSGWANIYRLRRPRARLVAIHVGVVFGNRLYSFSSHKLGALFHFLAATQRVHLHRDFRRAWRELSAIAKGWAAKGTALDPCPV